MSEDKLQPSPCLSLSTGACSGPSRKKKTLAWDKGGNHVEALALEATLLKVAAAAEAA